MKKLAGFLGALALLGVAPLAHADIQLGYSLNGGAFVQCSLATGGSPNMATSCFPTSTTIGGVVDIFNFSGQGQQSPPPTQTFSSTTHITNDTSSNQTLILFISDQNFTSPTAPPTINWTGSISFTSTAGSTVTTLNMVNCIGPGNTLQPGAGAPPAFCTGGQTLPNNQLSFTGANSSNFDTVTTTINALSAPYSLSQEITLVLGAGASFNIDTSQILTPVPEPAAIVFLGTAVLGVCGLFRRKQAKRA